MKKKIIKYLNIIFSKVKIKKIIIFESFPDYTDNTRVFYEYLLEQKKIEEYQFIWFVNDKKYFKKGKTERTKFINIWNSKNKITIFGWIKYIYFTKKAMYIIHTNRSMIRVNPKTKIIYLTHGCPTKNVKNSRLLNHDVDYVIVGSDYDLKSYAEHYNCDEDKIIALGLTRNDLFFREVSESRNTFFKVNNLENNKIITWLPTFRKAKNGNRIDSFFNFPLGIPIIYSKKDLEKLNSFLKANNLVIFLKPHPIQDLMTLYNYELSNFKIIDEKFLEENNLLLNNLLMFSDSLITDYSSVFNDYLLTNRPIIFTTDDYLEYKQTKGFMIDNYIEQVPGIKIDNIDELYFALNDFLNKVDNYEEKRLDYCKRVNKYRDGNSCLRLMEFLKLKEENDG